MGLMDFIAKKTYEEAEKERVQFIENCIIYDGPRLATEKYPESVKVIKDINYCGDDNEAHLLDIYVPEGMNSESFDEAFLLIHGGAFVYGNKELDKCFGMHVAESSNIPVINVNYRLAPEATMVDMLSDCLAAVDYVNEKYGVNKLHTTGDSAGGYLAYMMSLVINTAKIREDLGLVLKGDVKAATANPICGAFRNTSHGFPGIYFAGDKKLPDYVYDLGLAAELFGSAPTTIVTGSNDFLNADNHYLNDKLKSLGVKVEIRDYKSTSERDMHHVFSIAHPTWPEAEDSIAMMIGNAKGN